MTREAVSIVLAFLIILSVHVGEYEAGAIWGVAMILNLRLK